MRRRLVPLFLASAFAAALAAVPNPTAGNRVASLPQHRTVRIPSPDGRWLLIGSPFQLNSESTLTLVDRRTGQRSVIKSIDRDVDVAWSPDSKAFFLNDDYGSNVASAYVYPLGASAPLKLDDVILKADVPAWAADADYAYFQAARWISPSKLFVEYCGHNTRLPDHHFDFVYRVTLNMEEEEASQIRLVSRRTGPTRALADCRY